MGLKITKIKNIDTESAAYDISVESENHTVQLENGVFVHNSLRVPKQYFGDTDDSAGFDGGTSLSLISSRYAKTVKRIQNTFIQAITDAINLMLLDKGLTSYVNKFELHMVAPTTREEIDRQDSISSKIGLARDVMDLVTEIKDLSSRLRILKSLLDNSTNDPVIGEVLQEEIDRLETLKEQGIKLDENGDPIIPEDSTGLTGDLDGIGDLDALDDTKLPDFSPSSSKSLPDLSNNDTENNSTSDLPTPDSLGVDFTDSTNF